MAEDGYLTLRFRTLRSDMGKAHFVNLLHVPEADNPYVVEFRHNANGDVYGREADALVAFNLDRLPDTEGKTGKLTLKWNSFSGESAAEFDYCTRKSVSPSSTTAEAERRRIPIK